MTHAVDAAPPADLGSSEPIVVGRGRVGRRIEALPLSLFAVGLIGLLGVVKLVRALGWPFTSGGDVAFIELAVRQMVRGGTALGPYSRFGWHHPGPLLFAVMAPAYWLSGEASRSLFLSSWFLNWGCAVLIVLLVRRMAGELAARVSVIAIVLIVHALHFDQLASPWNPSLLAMPALLMFVCVAASAAGSVPALVGTWLVASYLVQTHIGTAPLCAVAVAIAVVAFLGGRGWRPRFARRERVVVIAGAALLFLVWLPPLYQQVTNHDGNLTQIARFYASPPRDAGATSHSLHDAAVQVSDVATAVPLGRARGVADLHTRYAWVALFVVLGIGGAIAGWRRNRFLAVLCLMTPVGLLVAELATTRIIGPLLPYLLRWLETIGIPALVGAGALAVLAAAGEGSGRRAVVAGWVSAAVLIGVTLAASHTVVLRGRSVSFGDSPSARLAAHAIEQAVGSRDTVFGVRDRASGLDAGAVALALAKDGYRFRLVPGIDLYSGSTSEPVDGPTFEVRSVSRNSPPPPAGTPVLRSPFIAVWQVDAASGSG